MDRRATLYKICFQNGKSYIGITTKTLESRVKGHIKSAKAGAKHALSCAIREHGCNSFSAIALAVGELEYIKEAEIKAIKVYGTLCPKGYNISYGGDTSPMMNPDVAKRVSEKMLANADKHPMKRTEHRDRMLGNKFGLGNSNGRGVIWSGERSAKHSELLIGNSRKKGKSGTKEQASIHSERMRGFYKARRDGCLMNMAEWFFAQKLS